MDYNDFVYEKFANNSVKDEKEENLKLIFKTIRTQNLKIQKIVIEAIKKTRNSDDNIKSSLEDLNNMIKNL